ncbi:MAG: hypothetical protein QXG39_08115 [Candidatus Aenigmatarchaeota archaeon]
MKITCPNCNSVNIIKRGIRKEKLKQIQLYFCKNCNKTFTLAKIKKTKYPEKIIKNKARQLKISKHGLIKNNKENLVTT